MDDTRRKTGFNPRNRTNKPVLLVDYDYFIMNEGVQHFVLNREHDATLVALVGTPAVEDPFDSATEHPDIPEVEWDVIIRNAAGHPDPDFKLSSLQALRNHSNLIPAVAIDLFNSHIYYNEGVLLTLDGGTFG